MKNSNVVAVFTGKDLGIMRTEGGSGYWLAKADRLKDAKYLIAVRNRRETWAVKDLEHGTCFLIAKITGCFKNPDYDDRNVVTFDEYAEVSVKNAWKLLTGGQRYPVAYLKEKEAFSCIGVNPEQLEWKHFQVSSQPQPNRTHNREVKENLTLSEALERENLTLSEALERRKRI